MNNDLKIINDIYKPSKYTLKGKVKILSTNDKDLVIKEKNPIISDRYKYLSSRGFNNFVPLIDTDRSNYDVFPFIYENNIPKEQKANELSRVAAIMHAKTSYNKEVDQSTYDDIYNNIINNCDYLKEYYSTLYDNLFHLTYHRPHEILFLDYYSKINNTILFCKSEIEIWYQMVSEKKNQRVSLIHNDLCLDHFIKADDDYLISFDKSKFDTPVLDMVKFYKKEYNNLDFSEVLKTYLYHFNFNEDELKLFFVLISLPDELVFEESNNLKNLEKIYNLCNYINKTEILVGPYYFNDKEEE